MRFRYLLLAGALAAAVPALAAAPRYAPWGLELKDMNTSVRPGDGFFEYAEGTWLKNHPIPADKTSAGYNYDLPDEIELQVRKMVEDAAANPTSPTAQKIGDAYSAWMDEAGTEARGIAPLKPYLDRIDAVTTRNQMAALMMQPSYASPVGIYITADQDDPTRYAVRATQGQLGLPTRDYYLLQGDKYQSIRKAYRQYIADLGKLAGLPDPEGRADRILALETRIAKSQWKPEQQRDPVATHNPMTRAQLMKLAPEFNWAASLRSTGLGSARTVDVAEKSAIAAAGKALAAVPLGTWKEYLAFRFISDHSDALPKAFDDANFHFYGRTLRDVPEQRARWKRGMDMLDGSLGEAVGQLYVAEHWPSDTAKLAQELVDDVRAAYAEKIAGASWMDAATRKAALEKLAAF
ncbi:MAG TPA: M13 family metallopeptidase N-terminal domain-containing protein, partial [Sphingomicrobium sp.]|nr:M13 family metallopeptidase N-terminal domain-containing protein [Sphingomicrobium sp.]